MQPLFTGIITCPVCASASWSSYDDRQKCIRCGYTAVINGRRINLLPDVLSSNNARELGAYETDDTAQADALLNYTINKPWNYPPFIRETYLREAEGIRRIAESLGPSPSVLFVFGGGGMEAHTSGLLGPNTVLADISPILLHQAEKRFDFYGVPQPAAFVQCDAERLPFATGSFDLVVGFEGVHHCMVPQMALQEIWRVAKRSSFVVDNLECALTNILAKFDLSSRPEGSGVKPNRFSLVALKTMLYNAKIDKFCIRPRTALPTGAIEKLGPLGSRLVTAALNATWQANMFTLATYRD